MTNIKDWLHKYKPLELPIIARFDKNDPKQAIGKGKIIIEIARGPFTIDVHYVLNITKHLLCIIQALSNGMKIEYLSYYDVIKHKSSNGCLRRTCRKHKGDLYPITCTHKSLIPKST